MIRGAPANPMSFPRTRESRRPRRSWSLTLSAPTKGPTPPHCGPWIPAFAVIRFTPHVTSGGSGGAGATRPITRAPHPASPRKEAGRGDGTPRFSTNALELPSRRRPRSLVGSRPLSPPLWWERFGEGPGDWPHGLKHDRSRRTKAESCVQPISANAGMTRRSTVARRANPVSSLRVGRRPVWNSQ
jgi:hypothetical protein